MNGSIAAAVLLFLSATGAAALQAQQYEAGFVVRVGNDTIATERYRRSGQELTGELIDRTIRYRRTYTVALGGNGRASRMSTTAWHIPATDPAPASDAVLDFVADSVIAEIRTPAPAVQRIASQPGAFPYVNLSLALTELILEQMPAADSASLPIFLVSGGQTLPVTLLRSGSTFRLRIAASEMKIEVDEQGRILQASVPEQNLHVTRVEGSAARGFSEGAPDYSAPPDAHYTAEEIVVRTAGGRVIAGTLTKPKGAAGRVPVAITISGSGQQDRDEAMPGVEGYRPFRQIAEALAARGIALFRYDDRGFGASTGDAAIATSADFADDVRAVLRSLRERPDVDAHKMVLIGHSEGGMIAPLVAIKDTMLAGIALLAGPAHSGRRILQYQQRYAIDNDSSISLGQRAHAFKVARAQLDSLARHSAWFRFFLDYDPLFVAGKLRVATLILHGSKDRQVTPEQAELLAGTIRKSGNSNVEVHVLPGVNHLFLDDTDGNPAGYSRLPSTRIPDRVMNPLTDWVVKRVR